MNFEILGETFFVDISEEQLQRYDNKVGDNDGHDNR